VSYYEDFGLPPNASPEQIREAYKLLVRLMHPDHQTNPALKWAAEGQMRRINQAYAVLSDPERRRRYDAEPHSPPERPSPMAIRTPPNSVVVRTQLHGAPLLWLGAAVFSLGAIIWLATQGQISLGPTRTASASSGEPRAEEQRAVHDAPAVRTRADAPVPETAASQESGPPEAEQAALAETTTPVPEVLAPPPSDSPTYTPPQLPAPELARLPPNHFGGFWALPHEKNFQRQSGQYLPQFIEATITEHDGLIRGKYRARYYVSDRPISPNVNFEFEGRPEGGAAKLPFHGEGGSIGILNIKLLSAEELELIWRATDVGQVLGLGSGTAVLMRRPD
jgi:hypothetical protein